MAVTRWTKLKLCMWRREKLKTMGEERIPHGCIIDRNWITSFLLLRMNLTRLLSNLFVCWCFCFFFVHVRHTIDESGRTFLVQLLNGWALLLILILMQLCRGRDRTIIGRTSFLCSTGHHGQCIVGFWRCGRGSRWMIFPEWLVVGIGLLLPRPRCFIVMLGSSLAVVVRRIIATQCHHWNCCWSKVSMVFVALRLQNPTIFTFYFRWPPSQLPNQKASKGLCWMLNEMRGLNTSLSSPLRKVSLPTTHMRDDGENIPKSSVANNHNPTRTSTTNTSICLNHSAFFHDAILTYTPRSTCEKGGVIKVF